MRCVSTSSATAEASGGKVVVMNSQDGKGLCTIKLFGGLRAKAGQAEFEFEGRTVGEVLTRLVRDNKELEEAIFAAEGLRPHVRVMLNGHDIELGDGLETAVSDNDQIAVFPPLAGG